MTKDQMANCMEQVFNECRQLREAGQAEYARDQEDAFSNFKRIGATIDVDPKKVLLTYALKHDDGILAYIDGHASQREDVRGRINDRIVYLCLLRGMIDEEEVFLKTGDQI